MAVKVFESIMRGLREVKEIMANDAALERDLEWAAQVRKLRKDLVRWEKPSTISKILKILEETGTPLFWYSIEDPSNLVGEENEETLRQIAQVLKRHVRFVEHGGKVPTTKGIPFKYAFLVTADCDPKILFTDIPNLDKYIVLEDDF
jgi:hypothetical protein